MRIAMSAGRVIGVLLSVQIVSGILVNFVLTAPLFGQPGFLESAAEHSNQIAVSVLLGIATGAISIGIAIAAYPYFRSHSQSLSLWFVALAVANFSVAAVENMNVLSMVSLSEMYAKASPASHDLFQGLRVVVASSRNWAHYVNLIIAGGMLLVFYTALYRCALIPRPLAAFGLAAVMLQLIAVTMPIFGHSVVFLMLAPLGVTQIAVALWLIAKGFPTQLQSGSERSG